MINEDDTEEEEVERTPSGRRKVKTEKLDIDLDGVEKRIEELIKRYSSDIEASSITVVDEHQIRTLAELTANSELANRKVSLLIIGTAAPQDIKAVGDTASGLSKEARQLATSLGLDRKSRVSEEESELETYLPQLHKEAKEFIYKQAIAIVCPHCLELPARVELRMGHILYHFAYELPWSFTTKCAKCGKEFTISNTNYLKFLFSELEKGIAPKVGGNEFEDDLKEFSEDE